MLKKAADSIREAIVLRKVPPPPDLQLIESEQRYQAVIENASDMIQSVRPDGTFEFVNTAWRTSLGYTDADLAQMTVWDIVHPDSMQHCQREFVRAIQGEPLEFFETTFVAKDGRAVPIEGSVTSRFLGDQIVATHGFFRDITERIRARELEERAARLEREERARYLEKMAALGKLSAGLAHELNNPAAAIQRANASLRETIERRDAAMRRLADADCEPANWRVFEQLLDRVQPSGEKEHGADPIALSENEAAIETWLEDHDIDRAWEFAPALAEADVTEQDLATIAASTPSTALPDAISWLTESVALRGSTEIIAQSSRRIAELVQSIKGYSHMDRATEHDGDIHEGIENTLIILAHRLRGIEIERQYDRSLPPIPMYGNTLNQVWTNILDNAIDAMDETGRIAIRTRPHDNHIVVAIEDTGKGIPADVLPRIFEPFYTSKPQGQGTGLGLDTAWRIVTEEHGGSITATSEPGRTVFQVTLPITPPPGSEVAVP
ncbi:MAG: PAS domain S-box protein [Chloroflexia bacterium]|nr:PAS domain S-box protein [Chloroflexia bacterium]